MTYITYGDRALANGHTKLAAAYFRQALAIHPNHLDALQGLATLKVAEKDYSSVEKLCRKILSLQPQEQAARFNLAMALLRQGKDSLAEEDFRSLLDNQLYGRRARFNLALVLEAQGKLDQARHHLQTLLKTPKDMAPNAQADAWTHLGQIEIDLGNPQAAQSAYAQAAQLLPRSADAWVNLSLAARAAGNFGYAITTTRKALDFAPGSSQIHRQLGDLLLELHRKTDREDLLTQAIEAWKTSLKLNPKQKELSERVETYTP